MFGPGPARQHPLSMHFLSRILLLSACLSTVAAHGQSPEALFLEGSAENRAGRFDAAGQLLRQAQAAGYRDAELRFELGWAAMGSRNWEECIVQLERYEQATPGRGQTSEFLGRCHLALRRPERAEALLKQALERDPRLASTANLLLAQIEQSRGNTQAARTRLESVTSADAPAGRALRDLAGPPDPVTQPDKPLRVSLSLSVGQNSNVIGLGNTIPLPADISRKSALFRRLSAGASYTRHVESDTAFTFGYAYLGDRYEDIGGANLRDHYVYADLFHQFDARIAFSLRVSGEFTTLGGARFRDVLSLRPALSYRFSPDAVTELAWSLSQNDYLAATDPAFRRDGDTQALSLVHSFRLRGSNWSGAVGATVASNRTDGSDFNSDSLGFSGTLRYTFPNRIVAALGASLSRDNYRDPNSLSGGAFARADRQHTISAQFTGPLFDKVRWFAQTQSLRNRSNIAFYDYRQSSVTAGVAWDY